MDEYDKKIVQSLLKDSKVSFQDLADDIGLSTSACFRRVQALQKSGVIERFTIQLNPTALGNEIKSFVEVKVNRQDTAEVENFKKMVHSRKEVLSCHQLSGNTDFLLHISVKNIEEYTKFIETKVLPLKAIRDVSSSIVLSEVKSYTVEI